MLPRIGNEKWTASFACIGSPFSGVGLYAAVPVESSGPATCVACERRFPVSKSEHALLLQYKTKRFGVVESYSLICPDCAGLSQVAIVGAMVKKHASRNAPKEAKP
jgi:hypothetical protein